MKRVLGVTLAAVALAFGATTNAYAADHTMHTNDGDPGGRIEFTANGDVVRICDIEADGWAATGGAQLVGSSTWPVWMTAGGNGECVTSRASDGGSHDLKEGEVYHFEICLRKSGQADSYCDDQWWVA